MQAHTLVLSGGLYGTSIVCTGRYCCALTAVPAITFAGTKASRYGRHWLWPSSSKPFIQYMRHAGGEWAASLVAEKK